MGFSRWQHGLLKTVGVQMKDLPMVADRAELLKEVHHFAVLAVVVEALRILCSMLQLAEKALVDLLLDVLPHVLQRFVF